MQPGSQPRLARNAPKGAALAWQADSKGSHEPREGGGRATANPNRRQRLHVRIAADKHALHVSFARRQAPWRDAVSGEPPAQRNGIACIVPIETIPFEA